MRYKLNDREWAAIKPISFPSLLTLFGSRLPDSSVPVAIAMSEAATNPVAQLRQTESIDTDGARSRAFPS